MPVRDTRHNLKPPPPRTESGRAVMAQAGMREDGGVVGAQAQNMLGLGTLPWVGTPLTGGEDLWPDLKTKLVSKASGFYTWPAVGVW